MRGTQGSYELRFDAAALRAALGPELLLHGAELRMLRKPYTAQAPAAQRVELYQVGGASGGRGLAVPAGGGKELLEGARI